MNVTLSKKPKAVIAPNSVFVPPHPYMFANSQERKNEKQVEYVRRDLVLKVMADVAKTCGRDEDEEPENYNTWLDSLLGS